MVLHEYHNIFIFLCFPLNGPPLEYIQDFVLRTRLMELCTRMCVSLLSGCVFFFFFERTSFFFCNSGHAVFPGNLCPLHSFKHWWPFASLCKILVKLGTHTLPYIRNTSMSVLYYRRSLCHSCLLDALREALMLKSLPRSLFLYFLLHIV